MHPDSRLLTVDYYLKKLIPVSIHNIMRVELKKQPHTALARWMNMMPFKKVTAMAASRQVLHAALP